MFQFFLCFPACPIGYYKSNVGNFNCVPCPANSAALMPGANQCSCNPGYIRYTGENTDAPCKSESQFTIFRSSSKKSTELLYEVWSRHIGQSLEYLRSYLLKATHFKAMAVADLKYSRALYFVYGNNFTLNYFMNCIILLCISGTMGPVRNLIVADVSETSAVLSWTVPLDSTGSPTSAFYAVQCRECDAVGSVVYQPQKSGFNNTR